MYYFTFKARFQFKDLLIGHLMAVALFYALVYWVIPSFRDKKKRMFGILYFFLSLLLFCFFRYLSKGVSDLNILKKPFDSFLHPAFFNFCLYVFFEYFIYALGFWFAVDSIKKNRNIAVLEQQRLEIENQFLKEQLSPHFLYNTLSFFYTKTLALDDNLAEGLMILTDILRYSLKTDGEKVPLELEVEHIENLIKINNLRFSGKLNFVFNKNFETESEHLLIPHVLITFVENAFKYGDSTDPDNPIRIDLKTTKEGIYFEIRNKKAVGFRVHSTGIGLSSLKKRLDFLYKEDYLLEIENEPTWYNVKLFIKGL
ncbi:sensor histidine kinase [Pedobacter sp. AW1-32]|uniref:sensor histidine kinase n=1 Tax=Pedobacter sp. AW1-32 TaxID=3383026 RepID=UPI003FEFB00C